MAHIQQQIEVAAEPGVVRSTWDRFVQWARTGPGHLTCSELACVDAVRTGLVDFLPAQSGGTTVVFRLDAPADGPSKEELGRQLGHDLVVFKDYVERSGLADRTHAATGRAAAKASAEHEDRAPHHARISGEGETTFRHSHYPT